MAEVLHRSLTKAGVRKSPSSETLQNLVKKYQTPLYVFDEATIRSKVNELRNSYSSFNGLLFVAYSMKANFNPTILKILMSENLLYDIATLGELYFFTRSGGSTSKVIYTSVTEEHEKYVSVIKSGVNRIVVSSHQGFLNLESAATQCLKKPKVLVRVNPEVNVKAEIRASYKHGKFGVPFNTPSLDSASVIVKKILDSENLEFEGFHFHLGSQITNPICFANSIDKIENFILKIRKERPDFSPAVIDIGGGTPVVYGMNVPSPGQISLLVIEKLNSMVGRLGCPIKLIVESGRYLTAESGTLVSRVVNTKMYADRKFIFVDIGFHLLLDSALLRQDYPVEITPATDGENNYKSIVAGLLCDTYDIFPVSQGSDLTGADEGKLVIFRNVGAYSTVFNMPFHCQTKPPIILIRENGEAVLIRTSRSIEDLFIEEGGTLSI